jgi:host factor-I protein
MINRKLIRPNLAEIKERYAPPHAHRPGGQESPAREVPGNGHALRRRPAPPEQTNAEAFYYLKQMNAQTPMVLILADGEQLRGRIEWYDRACLKVNREGAPNLLVFKQHVKYIYKQEEEH